MIRVWRLARRAFCPTSKEAFSGEGAALHGGRWNRKGTPLVYASGSQSLGILEVLVHIDRRFLASDYAFSSATIEESDVEYLRKPPHDWRSPARAAATVALGEEFVLTAHSLVLAVPSVVVPAEWNYLINPRFEGFRRLKIDTRLQEFAFDERLFAA